ncbi:TraR/DksA C4-type zinc finger protein [Catellatospora sp. KI3]|uniref:TraR/DksA family transcriptional regulator n=1 Tax=Catellatospora sp. KI3 TaxID=3041620 RepID=UPI00248316E4|nr:TraR/DksA C4-type zinc finger protein [Catellatospora sp. KI3]MDI1461628.1 TraR/DksA C4-type zinc finger protein [Catellatospora sp. KI3]
MTAVADHLDLTQLGALLRQRYDDAAEQLRIETEADWLRHIHDQGPGDTADAGTAASETIEHSLVTAALQDQLARLGDALGRLGEGTLGVCVRCGEQVPAGRLEVMPWATHCVPCQSIVDRRR